MTLYPEALREMRDVVASQDVERNARDEVLVRVFWSRRSAFASAHDLWSFVARSGRRGDCQSEVEFEGKAKDVCTSQKTEKDQYEAL